MNFFIIACEPSGDNHGAKLIQEIKKQRPDAEFQGLGGPQMAASGARLLHDMTTLSALGFGDVVRQYFTYRKIFYRALDEVKRSKPDAVILIDSPAFNLRFAKKLKNVPVFYYISPQLWAWGKRRIHIVKKFITKMLVILPFEKEMYDKAGIACEFVGHPLLDHLRAQPERTGLRKSLGIQEGQTAIGLLSGSRKKEVTRIFPLMLESAREMSRMLSNTVFYYQPAPNVPAEVYGDILKLFPEITVYKSNTSLHELTAAMDFALITSGTATLETALIGTPYFLLYKAGWSTYWLGRLLIKVKFLGLVNLLAGKAVVPEFIQNEIQPQRIAHEAKVLLTSPELYQKMKQDFEDVKAKLGQPGASRRASKTILETLTKKGQV